MCHKLASDFATGVLGCVQVHAGVSSDQRVDEIIPAIDSNCGSEHEIIGARSLGQCTASVRAVEDGGNAKNGRTTGPVVPAAPTCMCDAVTFSTLQTTISNDSVLLSSLSWTSANPNADVSTGPTC